MKRIESIIALRSKPIKNIFPLLSSIICPDVYNLILVATTMCDTPWDCNIYQDSFSLFLVFVAPHVDKLRFTNKSWTTFQTFKMDLMQKCLGFLYKLCQNSVHVWFVCYESTTSCFSIRCYNNLELSIDSSVPFFFFFKNQNVYWSFYSQEQKPLLSVIATFNRTVEKLHVCRRQGQILKIRKCVYP